MGDYCREKELELHDRGNFGRRKVIPGQVPNSDILETVAKKAKISDEDDDDGDIIEESVAFLRSNYNISKGPISVYKKVHLLIIVILYVFLQKQIIFQKHNFTCLRVKLKNYHRFMLLKGKTNCFALFARSRENDIAPHFGRKIKNKQSKQQH